VNDATKVAATRTGGAGTGGYQVTVTQLAGAHQHWYKYAPPAADENISIGGRPYTIAAGSDLAAAASVINSDSDSAVYASAVTESDGTTWLALTAKKTGSSAAFDFSLTGGSPTVFDNDAGSHDVGGRNAQGTVGTRSFDEPTNTIADMIPGISLTLKGQTGATPVTVTVGAPGPNTDAVAAKVKAFVEQYNSTVSFIKSKLDEKPVPNATTSADANKGVLYGDTVLTGLLSQMRLAMTGQYTDGTNPLDLDQMLEIGVSTGKSVASGTLNQDSIAGKLSFDQDTFKAAVAKDSASVRRLLGGNTSVNGFAQGFDKLLSPMLQADGTIDQAISSQDRQRRDISAQLGRMDDLLAQKQEALKRQFASMEAALQASQSQGNWLQGQLNALNNR
jgi:flagellar hook-associated protein 2